MRVLILLATCNGERFLAAQLQSLAAQSWPALDLCVSDDRSTDATQALLAAAAARWSKGSVTSVDGPGQGFAANFRHLIRTAPGDPAYVAFCDQDDLWDADKIEVAIAALRRAPPGVPALYGSRSRWIDAAGRPVGHSPLFPFPPGFANALVQSLAGGNTMVMNAPAFALLRESARRTGFLLHDWWSYLLVSGAGGEVTYDPQPHLSYRQHPGNAIGGGGGLLARLGRLGALLDGRFSGWSDRNIESPEACLDLLTPEARHRLRQFKRLRRADPFTAVELLLHAGLYRQTIKGNVALAVGAALGRI